MAEFQELIKNFERIRDYMRQFYIYGFKVRGDYDGKSARTYDNERRRIESWLYDYMKSDYTPKGKHIYINVDSKTISQNPLYAAWKSKSFTDNDLMLHYYILDLLWDCPGGMGAGEISDEISRVYGMAFDTQTVRLKLKEYEDLGILVSQKTGKNLYYTLVSDMAFYDCDLAKEKLITAVKFFQEAAPFGFIGSTILDREAIDNDMFQFKHHFIVHTLEDGVLADILAAMKQQRQITFLNKSSRTSRTTTAYGIPLKIFVSTQTGRRYLCLYQPGNRRFSNFRLDSITQVTIKEWCGDYAKKLELLERNKDKCWGVSFGGNSRLEKIYIKLSIDETKEAYILNRLQREGRGGTVEKIRDQEYLYSGEFFDTHEMLSWVKTLTGRIMDIQGSNVFAVTKVTRDWEKMYEMYCTKPAQPPDDDSEGRTYGAI